MKTYILFFAFFFSSLLLKAQFAIPIKEDALAIEQRKFLVEINVEDPSIIKKLSKESPEAVNKYKTQLNAKNEIIKNSIKKFWKLNSEYEFITRPQIFDYSKRSNENNVILIHDYRYSYNESFDFKGYTFALYLSDHMNSSNGGSWYDDFINEKPNQTGGNKGPYLFKITLFYDTLNDNIMQFVFTQFTTFINLAKTEGKEKGWYRAFFDTIQIENISEFKNKTLLIPSELLDSTKIKESDIATVFKTSFKITPYNQIYSLINAEPAKYAYIIPAWSDIHRGISFFIVNPLNGNIIYELSYKEGDTRLVTPGKDNIPGLKYKINLDVSEHSIGTLKSLETKHFEVLNNKLNK